MSTFLIVLLVLLIAANIWYGCYAVKCERERRRNYQERLDECDERLGDMVNELGKAKQHLSEAQSAQAALKRSYEETVAAYEKHIAECGKEKPAEDVGAEPDTPLKAKPTSRSKKRAKK